MAATDEQRQAAKTMHEATVWMAGCPMPGRHADAMYETFGAWFDAVLEQSELQDAYNEELEAEDAAIEAGTASESTGDTEWAFWEAVLARV